MNLQFLKIQLYADGADLASIIAQAAKPHIAGLTTNPTLMRKAGVTDYEAFARQVIAAVPDKPISFEVLADDEENVFRQAMAISEWGSNVFVKVPIVNSLGRTNVYVIGALAEKGVQINVTAVMTSTQVHILRPYLTRKAPSIVSVFAGRIADTGVDPMAVCRNCAEILAPNGAAKLLWASTREVYNIRQAQESGCHIITVPNDILAKAEKFLGYDLDRLSLDTVQMFDRDAKAAGFSL